MTESIPLWLLGWTAGFVVGFVFWLIIATRDHHKLMAKYKEVEEKYSDATKQYKRATAAYTEADEYVRRMGRTVTGANWESNSIAH